MLGKILLVISFIPYSSPAGLVLLFLFFIEVQVQYYISFRCYFYFMNEDTIIILNGVFAMCKALS